MHRLDAARLFRLALESAPAGTRLHEVADEGVPFRDIAGVIGRHLNLPVVSVSGVEATAHSGWLGGFAPADCPASSTLTHSGWDGAPSGPGSSRTSTTATTSTRRAACGGAASPMSARRAAGPR